MKTRLVYPSVVNLDISPPYGLVGTYTPICSWIPFTMHCTTSIKYRDSRSGQVVSAADIRAIHCRPFVVARLSTGSGRGCLSGSCLIWRDNSFSCVLIHVVIFFVLLLLGRGTIRGPIEAELSCLFWRLGLAGEGVTSVTTLAGSVSIVRLVPRVLRPRVLLLHAVVHQSAWKVTLPAVGGVLVAHIDVERGSID